MLAVDVEYVIVFACVEMTAEWTEDTVKLCLAPFLGLVSQNHKLIHELVKPLSLANFHTRHSAPLEQLRAP